MAHSSARAAHSDAGSSHAHPHSNSNENPSSVYTRMENSRHPHPGLALSLQLGHDRDSDHNDHGVRPHRQGSTASQSSSNLDSYYFDESPSNDTDMDDHAHSIPLAPPLTPARDPSSIDRRMLIGVGDLATPRWTSNGDTRKFTWESVATAQPPLSEEPEPEEDADRDDGADSPWTIEAVDSNPENGDSDNAPSQLSPSPSPEKVAPLQPLPQLLSPPRTVRGRPSLTEESGGEEILYPRAKAREHSTAPAPSLSDQHTRVPVGLSPASAPPDAAAFDATAAVAPFAMDNGAVVAKSAAAQSPPLKDDKLRRHRSLGSGSVPASTSSPRDKAKDRRRTGAGLNVTTVTPKSPPSASASLHSRGPSNSSATGASPHRSVHDFSHLPPSPSAAHIPQQFKSTGSTSNHSPTVSSHSSTSVAQSLLRGTQEGWNALDDSTTSEMLRKLDGIPAKSLRARSSISSTKSSSSRPGTPGAVKSSSTQWEGIDGGTKGKRASQEQHSEDGVKKRGSHGADSLRENFKRASVTKPADRDHGEDSGRDVHSDAGLSAAAAAKMDAESLLHSNDYPTDDAAAWSSSQASPPSKKVPLKDGTSSARSSYGIPKRGSTSSTNFTGTPTSMSRDSTSMSTAATSVTSPSFSSASGRDSSKMRRNSAGSDMSGHYSSSALAARDRAAALAGSGGEGSDDATTKTIPPVPPIPKLYQSGVPSASMPAVSAAAAAAQPPAALPVAPVMVPPTSRSNSSAPNSHDITPTGSEVQRPLSIRTSVASPSKNLAPPTKTPTKKWSFSSALNLKLGSHEKDKDKGKDRLDAPKSPLSPRASKSSMKADDRTSIHISTAAANKLSETWVANETASPRLSESWTPIEKSDASSPRTSIQVDASSPQSISVKSNKSTGAAIGPRARTPDRGPSRSDAGSSTSNHTSSALSAHSSTQNQRLTPSAIPFFRRGSSNSIQAQSGGSATTTPPPPPQSTQTQAMHKGSSSAGSNLITTRPPMTPPTEVPLSPSTTKKHSALSIGLSNLLKSSSRKSVLLEKGDEAKLKDAVTKVKKEDRSESRISVLMGRKRGKVSMELTLSSSDEKKERQAAPSLPPIQMTLPSNTVQRVASLRQSSGMGPPSSANSSTSSLNRMSIVQTTSAPAASTDSSLRARAQLPTISGSPSVSTTNTATTTPYAGMSSSLTKETPTKIPRIGSRGSTRTSPAPNTAKPQTTVLGTRRGSMATNSSSSADDGTSTSASLAEFGMLDDSEQSGSLSSTARSTASSITASVSIATPRKPIRESIGMSIGNLRKSSNASISSVSSGMPSSSQTDSATQPSTSARSRFSALSPSKSLKILNAKVSSATRSSAAEASTASFRHSLTTPSPAPDDDELLGDPRRLATELLKFPEPIPPKAGQTPQEVLSGPGIHSLSDYEREEVNKYPSDKKPATRDNSQFNYSYDDDRGDYQVINRDHLAYRYEIVLHCRDHCTGESRFHHQALVEIKILDNLKKWDPDEKHHVIKMEEYFYFRNHLCIAMELLSINLYELIKANGFVGFSTNLIRRFTTQMLSSLALMRHHRVVHCDLKPENVLLRHPAKSGIKTIDFGSSCFEHEKVYTYIQSRFYRSPEVILGMNYSMAIDMWSLGCILAELYTGYPIFPGENEQEQLACIMEVLGVPDKDIIRRSSRQKLFFDASGAPRPVVNSKGRRRRPGSKSLADVLKCQDEVFVDFIAKCLIWDPERRLKPAPAMRHPFVLQSRRGVPTKPVSPAPGSSSRSLLGGTSSRKTVTDTLGKAKVPETPKKSLISGPTPLTSRSAHRAPGSSIPPTPASTVSSTSRYRTSQPTYSLSSRHLSGTISGYSSASKS
ncbi:hypothetical protein BKA62DRAFT_694675 [Auriculariales sp. MPI-PUGE-AT-0066]|nr:hypothetical protein BKA62DRAFT_694675 [Auriculariales sp. MPI-PUGE-AT-0066]